MTTLKYATTNVDKFTKAVVNLRSFGISLEQVKLELDELQSLDGELITTQKAEQAFRELQEPVLVCDDSWAIPALRGFPGTNMKQCNHYLTSDDWLQLMTGKKDRRIFLTSYFGFCRSSQPQVLSYIEEFYFLPEKKGKHWGAQHLMVIARQGQAKSLAEEITEGVQVSPDFANFWRDLAEVILK